MTSLPGDWPAVRPSGPGGYELVLLDKFVEDLRSLAAEARRDPGGQAAALRLGVLRVIKQFRLHPTKHTGEGPVRSTCV